MPTDDPLDPPSVRTRAMIPVATITLAMLAYGDVDAVTGGEAVRQREQSKLPRYLRSERLHLDHAGARPKDCFRCHGERATCPMHTGNWPACPHAK